MPSVDSRLPLIAIIFAPMRLIIGKIFTISLDSPLLEIASTISLAVTIPKSPWKASAGCIKNDGVPVLAKLAAIFLPT